MTINVPNTTAAGLRGRRPPVLNGTGTGSQNAALSPTGDVTINNGTNNTAATGGGRCSPTAFKTVNLTGFRPPLWVHGCGCQLVCERGLDCGRRQRARDGQLTNVGGPVLIDPTRLATSTSPTALKASATTAGPTVCCHRSGSGFTAIPARTLNLNPNNTTKGTGVVLTQRRRSLS